MTDSVEPIQLPLCSHGGMLDDLNHALTIAGTELGRLQYKLEKGSGDSSELIENVMNQLRRIESLSRMMDMAARAGCLKLLEPTEEDLDWWKEASKSFSETEISIVERSKRVRQ